MQAMHELTARGGLIFLLSEVLLYCEDQISLRLARGGDRARTSPLVDGWYTSVNFGANSST